MVTSKDCLKKYGEPGSVAANAHMVVWDIPAELEFGAIPKRLYCNKDLVGPLSKALRNVKDRGLGPEIKTWDGCFNIRKKRGGGTPSLHSWGIAVDINAAWNQFGKTPSMPAELVKCFTDAGFDWGGKWTRADGMHMQLSRI